MVDIFWYYTFFLFYPILRYILIVIIMYKRFLYLVLIILFFPFISCKEKDEVQLSIIGTWNCYYHDSNFEEHYCQYLIINENYIEYSNEPKSDNSNSKFEYLYNVNDQTIIFPGFWVDPEIAGNFDTPFSLSIIKLTSNELDLEWRGNGNYVIYKYKRYK